MLIILVITCLITCTINQKNAENSDDVISTSFHQQHLQFQMMENPLKYEALSSEDMKEIWEKYDSWKNNRILLADAAGSKKKLSLHFHPRWQANKCVPHIIDIPANEDPNINDLKQKVTELYPGHISAYLGDKDINSYNGDISLHADPKFEIQNREWWEDPIKINIDIIQTQHENPLTGSKILSAYHSSRGDPLELAADRILQRLSCYPLSNDKSDLGNKDFTNAQYKLWKTLEFDTEEALMQLEGDLADIPSMRVLYLARYQSYHGWVEGGYISDSFSLSIKKHPWDGSEYRGKCLVIKSGSKAALKIRDDTDISVSWTDELDVKLIPSVTKLIEIYQVTFN